MTGHEQAITVNITHSGDHDHFGTHGHLNLQQVVFQKPQKSKDQVT